MAQIINAWTGRALSIIITVRVSYLVIPFFSGAEKYTVNEDSLLKSSDYREKGMTISSWKGKAYRVHPIFFFLYEYGCIEKEESVEVNTKIKGKNKEMDSLIEMLSE